jgi:ketosteroid isomerase-like protein
MRGGRRTAISIATLTASLAVWSFGTARAADRAADVAVLTRLSDDWDKAIVRKDEKAIAGNMAEDFRQIDGDANIETKKSFVAGIVDPRLTIDPYTVEDFEVRLYGDTALLSGRSHMTGKFDGQPFTSNYRYIDVYARRGGEWKIVSVQITRIPPQRDRNQGQAPVSTN